jgi:GTPase Era involved in 16S rRNA processing
VLPILKVAIVGHTNTGKTSLVRTLTRDVGFGEVSDRPATTRHVEGAVLLAGGRPLVELYDTPGLEDPIGLLEHLDALRGSRKPDWIDVIRRFLDSDDAHGRFGQEAKAIRQVLASDVALYVIDARDRVLGKHRDELEILGRCARPVVPVLNFVASAEARSGEWREHLTRVNMHAVAEFDTVVLNEESEQRLFEKMETLLDPFRPTLAALIADRRQQRADLVRSAAELLADLLIDVAAYVIILPEQDAAGQADAVDRLQRTVRRREQDCVDALIEVFRFRADDYEADSVPVERGLWGLDLFNPASLKQFGIRAGGGAAAGGLAGLALDAMTGGLSLGAAAALGATLGAFWGSFESHGRRFADRLRGFTELRLQEPTLRLLAVRQIELVQALLRRGHASQDKIRLQAEAELQRKAWASQRLPDVLLEARVHPEWSRLDRDDRAQIGADRGRSAAVGALAQILETALAGSAAPAVALTGGPQP